MEHMSYCHLMVTLFLYAVMEDCIDTQSLLDIEPLSWTGQRL